ncbi:MAG: ACT domain-containing protein [Armatimonadota bacterium]|nr:ACT domain-containing protein [bacterium]
MYNEIRVFVENKPGKLAKISGVLGEAGIDIINLDLADDGQFGIFKLLTADPAKAKQALADAGMTVAFNKVAVIEIDDQPGGLVKLARALEGSGLSVQDAYGCILERGKRAIFVVKGENVEAIETAVKNAGLTLLDSLI